MLMNSTLAHTLCAHLTQSTIKQTQVTFLRKMSHNPKWLREKTKTEERFAKLRSSLLAGTFVPRMSPEERRAARLYAPKSIGAPITGPVEAPATPILESWVYNLKKERVGIIGLSNRVFNADTSRGDLVQRTIVWQLAKRRAGTHQSLNRSTVTGTGKKPHPQKKSGRARASTLRSPLHYKGARAFPLRNRDYGFALPIAIRRKALAIALSAKRKSGDLVVVDTAKFDTHKTAEISRALKQFTDKPLLVITGDFEEDPNFVLGTRNLSDKVHVLPARGANVYDIVKNKKVMITVSALRDLSFRIKSQSRTIEYPGIRYELLPKQATIEN